MPGKAHMKQLPPESLDSQPEQADSSSALSDIDEAQTLSLDKVVQDDSGSTKRKRAVVEHDEEKARELPKRTKRMTKIKDEDKDVAPLEQSVQKPNQKARIKTQQRLAEEEESLVDVSSPKKSARKTKIKLEHGTSEAVEDTPAPKKHVRKAKVKVEDKIAQSQEAEEPETKGKRKRKTKEEKAAEAMPLAARTSGLNMFIGAHVSCAKGVQNSVINCLHIGGNAFAMFLKSQRKWENPPLQDDHRDQFRAFCHEHNYDAAKHIMPHGSYLVNLAQEDPEKHTQGYNAFVDDLHRCESLGIKLYNFHPGWTGPTATRDSALTRIAVSLNRAHSVTKTVIPVLETMAGSGSVIGSTFSDLASIINQVDDKSRVGVCIDTCHIFAAGYDLRSPSTFACVMDEFEKVIGFKYLKALHLNDSKAPFGSHRDLHANIGTGFLGLRAFHNVMNEKRFHGLPMVLETPIDKKDPQDEKKTIEDKAIWAKEIKMLESLEGMDMESEEFRRMEVDLSEQGREERDKHWEQHERKLEKEAKAAAKSTGKSRKKGAEETRQGKQTTLKWKSSKAVGHEMERDNSDSDLSSVSAVS